MGLELVPQVAIAGYLPRGAVWTAVHLQGSLGKAVWKRNATRYSSPALDSVSWIISTLIVSVTRGSVWPVGTSTLCSPSSLRTQGPRWPNWGQPDGCNSVLSSLFKWKPHGGYGGFFINCYQSGNELIKWQFPHHCRFCFFWGGGGFALWFLLSSLGIRWTQALGALLCLVPYGSCYIYGPHGLKFITRLSCYLADLLA